MNTTRFSVFSKVQDIKVMPDEVTGNYDGLKSFLNVFVKFSFRRPSKQMRFEVTSLSAKLKLNNPNVLLSQAYIMPAFQVQSDFERDEVFNFELDEKAISVIEKNRSGDINFLLDLNILVLVLTEVNAAGSIVNTVEGTYRNTAMLQFQIPKSKWVETVLPTLGYQSFKLIEIPLTHKTLKEAYVDIIFEFNKAESYFNQQDYNKCVAHCRSTLDALTRNLKKIKESTESESAFKWLKNKDEATCIWIDNLNKATTAICSKTHHAGLKRNFTRYEAESIYLVTLGLLNFIGHII